MMKKIAKKGIPKVVKVRSRKIFVNLVSWNAKWSEDQMWAKSGAAWKEC
jgi:hypothetical protein